MPDHDDLSTFTDGFSEGMHVNPIPASEVRRRGDRMRRRNTALAAVGGVAAAAVFIGVPVALTTNSSSADREPQPAPSVPTQTDSPDTEPTWVTTIPDDFSLSQGMTTENGTLVDGDQDAFALCDFAYPTSQGTTDTRTVFFSSDGESSQQRTFQLWPDDTAAEASLDALVAGVQGCPDQPTEAGDSVLESRLVDFSPGTDRTVTFTQQVVEDDGLVTGLTTVEATVVGNAVLVDSTYGSAGGDEAISIATQLLADHSSSLRAGMCVFSADPCSAPPETTETSEAPQAGTPIPAGFPLADGLDEPSSEVTITGPGPDVEGAPVIDVCGTDVFSTSGVLERLAVRETGLEYLETHELYTFPTADEPIEALTTIRDAVRDCPHYDGELNGYTTKILDGPSGYDSFTWGSFADDGLDGGVFQITRVGSAILVVYASGETSEASLQPTADGMTPVTLALAQQMCVFTEDGC